VYKGSEFKHVLTENDIPFHSVAPEEHQGILCECFNGFLDRVECIHGIQNSPFEEFYASVLMAAYAWNSAPVNGVNVQRSFAEKHGHLIYLWDSTLEEPPPMGNPAIRTIEDLENCSYSWHRAKGFSEWSC
jgi:hypothetical protein